MWLQRRGQFTDPGALDSFLRFVRIIVGHLGDLVDDWITINEATFSGRFGRLLGRRPDLPVRRYADATGTQPLQPHRRECSG